MFAVLIDEHEHIIIDCNNFLAAESCFKIFVVVDCVINLLIIGVVFGDEFDGVGKGIAFGPHERTREPACGVRFAGEVRNGAVV